MKKLAAIPFVAHIHGGLVTSNRSAKTYINKLSELICARCEFQGDPAGLNFSFSSGQGVVLFVFLENLKERAILMSNDISAEPESIIKIDYSSWMIETGFKVANHQLATFTYPLLDEIYQSGLKFSGFEISTSQKCDLVSLSPNGTISFEKNYVMKF